ncbi:MAG: HYR domain-containing protein [Armatimonadetes bacterium]|nr:HYR domain-containing protein [Armatimonadota bacterium]
MDTRARTGTGTGVSGLVNPAGDRVYARSHDSGGLTGKVDVFDYNSATGALAPAPLFTINVTAPSLFFGLDFFGIDQMALHPNGSKLYGSEPGALRVCDASTGAALTSITSPNIVRPTGVALAPNLPPTATCPAPVTVECESHAGTVVSLFFAVEDPDGDALTGTLTVDGGSSTPFSVPGSGPPTVVFIILTLPYTLGTHTVALTVDDGKGGSDSCETTVTVVDTTPPTIICPADIVVPTDPGQCSAVVNYPPPTVTDICDPSPTVVCDPPSGSAFPVGTTTVTCTATDASGNTSQCSFTVTVEDREAPVVTCRTLRTQLWPPNHNLVNVGLSVTATDQCDLSPGVTVAVFSDEDDDEPTGDGNHSPDAKNIAPGTLWLRAERKGNANGRVYLIVVKATDAAGNVAFDCCTVVVPLNRSAAAIASVNAQAAAAQAFCAANNGAAPPGFVPVGDGPILGPKQ